jgi:Fic family protein
MPTHKAAIPARLPIEAIDWAALIPSMGRANRSLADYNGMLRHLPNASMLLAPLTVQEAVLSSRIEGTLATMSEVLQFEAGELPAQESRRHDIEEILNYRDALAAAKSELETRPFSLNLLLKLHHVLLRGVRGQHKARGEFRRQQNYIGSVSGGKETIRFTPPEWRLLPKALDEWEKYYHSECPDPIVQLAIIHAQFEFLHPFLDGNGRLGRILVPVFLFEKGLLQEPNFYLSEYIEAQRDEYIDLLNQLSRTKNSWTNWVRFFLGAVEHQANQNAKRAMAMLALYEQLKDRFIHETRSQFAVPLLDFIFSTPVFQPSQVEWRMTPPSKPTLTSMLLCLHKAGILTMIRKGVGRSSYIWALTPLIDLAEQRFSEPHQH